MQSLGQYWELSIFTLLVVHGELLMLTSSDVLRCYSKSNKKAKQDWLDDEIKMLM